MMQERRKRLNEPTVVAIPPALAKVNLALRVVGKFPSGMHCIQSIICPLSLSDEITLELYPTAENKSCTVQFADELGRHIDAGIASSRFSPQEIALLSSDKNLAVRALEAFIDRFLEGTALGYRLVINKAIPFQAGMGGGSADAAAVLHGMSTWAGIDLDCKELLELALRLGADVPAMLQRELVVVEGIGGRIVRPDSVDLAPGISGREVVILKPFAGVSTAEAYKSLKKPVIEGLDDVRLSSAGVSKQLDLLPSPHFCDVLRVVFGDSADRFFLKTQAKALTYTGQEGRCLSPGIAAVEAGERKGGDCVGFFSEFESPVSQLQSQVAEALQLLRARVEFDSVFLSGSGSAVIGVVAKERSASEIRAELSAKISQGWFLDCAKLLP